MDTFVYLGREVLVRNELGEKVKTIQFENLSLFCKIKNVKRSEYYQAMQSGLNVEKVISMNKYEYYDIVKNALKKYARVVEPYTQEVIDYTIIREYEVDSDNVELTLLRGVENAHA